MVADATVVSVVWCSSYDAWDAWDAVNWVEYLASSVAVGVDGVVLCEKKVGWGETFCLVPTFSTGVEI